MRLLGLSAGRIDGNSEILLKAALLGAKDACSDLEVCMIRVPSARIPRYAPPLPSSMFPLSVPDVEDDTGKNDADDRPLIFNAIMDADAIIISTPVHCHMPPGCLKTLFDTVLGPHADIAMAMEMKERLSGAKSLDDIPSLSASNTNLDTRLIKPRVSGFIVVSGSPESMPEQFSLGLVALHQTVFSLQATTVDQAQVSGFGLPGAVLLEEERAIERARLLGQRVASQMGLQIGEARYLGPSEEGSCDYCHLKLIRFRQANSISCGVCGAWGDIKVKPDGTLETLWEPDSGISHLTLKGKQKHHNDLRARMGEVTAVKAIQSEYQRWKDVEVESVL